MIRTGYLRWEIEADERRCAQDRQAREAILRARPSYRIVRVRNAGAGLAGEAFVRGEQTYDAVLQALRGADEVDLRIPDVGPHVIRYDEAERRLRPGNWMAKVRREVGAFAADVVGACAKFPQLVISHPGLRANYAAFVEAEALRVLSGASHPAPTNEQEPMILDAGQYRGGVPELVAAELVRDVVTAAEFAEFCAFDRVTVVNGEFTYRIPRRPHALIGVWEGPTHRPKARLCVVFRDPGMPPSDEVVMKYLLARHHPHLLWEVGVRFTPPGPWQATGPVEEASFEDE